MSNLLITGVAAGSATIHAKHRTSGKTVDIAATVSAPAGVTSVTPAYNGQANPVLLLFAGQDYSGTPLTAKDQSGNVLDGTVGSWSSDDPTNCPINATTGVVSPNAGVTGGSILHYTHTASGKVGTVAVTVLKKPAAWAFSTKATDYASDTAFMADIINSVSVDASYNSNVPTGGGSAKFNDGQNCNRITLDATRPFMGEKTFNVTIPAHPTGETSTSLRAYTPGQYSIAWALKVYRFDPGFDIWGINNGSTGSAYKITPWLSWRGLGGRIGPTFANGTSTGGATFSIDNQLQNGPGSVGGSGPLNIQNITTEFTAAEWWATFVRYEVRSSNIMSGRFWHFKVGTNPSSWLTNASYPTGAFEGPMQSGFTPPLAGSFSGFGENMNDPMTADQHHAVAGLYVVDGQTYPDPFGLLASYQSSPTLTGITGGTVTHGTTGNSIVLTGTGITQLCSPVFSNTGIKVQSITINSATQMTVVVNVDSAATTGAGTVAVFNSASGATSGTQAVTVA